MGAVRDELFKWVRPVIVYIACAIIYNFFIAGNLVGIPTEFGSVKTDSKYKITCNFELKNKGFLTVKAKKIQLNIPKEAAITDIDIPRQYNYLYRIIDGGENHNFLVFLVEGIKGRKNIVGSVIFAQNTKWEKDYINPISFSK